MLTPFLVAITGSPSKYAARCSSSVKSSTLFKARWGAEQPLDVHAAKGRRVQAVSEFLGPDVAHQVRGAVGMPVHVAVEARDAPAGNLGTAVLGLIELRTFLAESLPGFSGGCNGKCPQAHPIGLRPVSTDAEGMAPG